jgi:hypothetical protein
MLQTFLTWLKHLWLSWFDPDALPYTPEYLKLWKLPSHYFGEHWDGWYVFLTTNRDAGHITESNWDTAIKLLGGENPSACEELRGLLLVEENHWAVGWVGWMGIHSTDYRLLRKADELAGRLEDYPVLDDEDLSSRECDEQYRYITELVKDFNNALYKFVHPGTEQELPELTDEEMEFIVEMECQAASDWNDHPSDDELWADYWKVQGKLLHCKEHGTFLPDDPCTCQLRMPV